MTYGVNSAPFLALRVLHDIADRCGSRSQSVQMALRLQTYMEYAQEQRHSTKLFSCNSLIETLMTYGFELKKWSSNTPALLEGIPKGTVSYVRLAAYD